MTLPWGLWGRGWWRPEAVWGGCRAEAGAQAQVGAKAAAAWASRSSRLQRSSSRLSPSPRWHKELLGRALLRADRAPATHQALSKGGHAQLACDGVTGLKSPPHGSIWGRERCLKRPVCLVMDRCPHLSVAQSTGPGRCGQGKRQSPTAPTRHRSSSLGPMPSLSQSWWQAWVRAH